MAVFVSGGGTNLQCLLDTFADHEHIRIGLVLSNREQAGGLRRAATAGVPAVVLANPADGAAIRAVLADHDIHAIVLAGYLKLMPQDVVAAFEGRMINIHPALLPSFGGEGMYGQRVHQAVLDARVTVSGPTVHLVSEAYDEGHILAQWPVAVQEEDTAETLAARVLAAEHALLPKVVATLHPGGQFRRVHPPAHHFASSPVPPSAALD